MVEKKRDHNELAAKATVTQGGISRMLTRLEKEGLIERKQNWKTKTIFLTEAGKQKLEEAFDAQLAFQSSFFDECFDVMTLTTEIGRAHV